MSLINNHSHHTHPVSQRQATRVVRPNTPARSLRPELRLIELQDLTWSDREAWEDLERDTASPNPFLSPGFVLPAARHLRGCETPVLLVIDDGHDWLAMGVFEAGRVRRRVPVPHLRSWQTPYTFLDGLLLRQGQERAALDCFWNYLQQGIHNWHAVEFPQLAEDRPDFALLQQTAAERGVEPVAVSRHARASLNLHGQSETDPSAGISPRRQRSLRQAWNWLNRQGVVDFHFERNTRRLRKSCQRFLELESLGWKGDEQTALVSRTGDRRFFEEMSLHFAADHRLVISELDCGQQTIGSVVHLLAGSTAYAFKLGWDPRFARGCPGYQLKAQMMAHATQQWPEIGLIDSCACPDSFIEHIWPDRRCIQHSVFLTSRTGMLAGAFVDTLRWLRDCGRRWIPRRIEADHTLE